MVYKNSNSDRRDSYSFRPAGIPFQNSKPYGGKKNIAGYSLPERKTGPYRTPEVNYSNPYDFFRRAYGTIQKIKDFYDNFRGRDVSYSPAY